MKLIRQLTKQIKFNNILLGGNNNIYIQSMTNTKTSDLESTLRQINELKLHGCDYVRVAVLDDEDANSLTELVQKSSLPLVADIHFNYKYAIKAINSGIKKIRLNPGNISNDEQLKQIIQLAKLKDVVIRIGLNSGSLPDEWLRKNNNDNVKTMINLCKFYIKKFHKYKFYNIVLSFKSTNVNEMIKVNMLAAKTFPYPLHLGVTESGPMLEGSIKSASGLTPLLINGIGNTIRVSITDNPVKEIYVAKKILNNLDLRHDMVDIISCPTCGRLQFKMFDLVEKVKKYTLNLHFPLKISILGCVVNGIGEGKHADIGVAGGDKKGILFKNGQIYKIVNEDQIYDELVKLIDEQYLMYKNSINK